MKNITQNTVIKNVQIESMTAEGKCVARIDGQVVFVEKVAPGDVVDLKITGKRKKFLHAQPTDFQSYSEHREKPFCEHFGVCGGCKWQHINYETQLFYKRQQVIDSLERIAKVNLPEIEPIIPSGETAYYRNKLEFTFSNKRWLTYEEVRSDQELDRNALGFHMPGRFDKIIDIEHCHLQQDPSNEIRLALKEYAKKNQLDFYELSKFRGLLRNLIVRTSNIGEIMVIVQFGANEPTSIESVMQFLKEKFPQITSLQYVINTKGNETFHDLEVVRYSGQPYIIEEMDAGNGGKEVLKFQIGPKSFFQTNSGQAQKLYEITKKYAQLSGDEIVYDLYTGTGTIANFVARSAQKVIGLEYVEQAIEDAKVNSKINKIDNTDFFAGDIKDLLNTSFLDKHGYPNVIITDPPRAGMHVNVIDMLLKAEAEKIVYVSCNPGTQARDLALLDSKYKVEAVQPVDMFPHTHHTECVVLLELRE
ncbi:23S rRNA (uracil(1939)-C(5))-methyltransferase RlmD [Fulvivirgaceae bacterium BMA10]|uniref:23S rRNA (Uracil(1939)-C(5))-methyltransferase RlmD n=1 Tax=Splendidivirga corallicola TaxID=3051826 RepID=A0ABT8KKL8_9BACT|nr:23S rRNA (uracil(1939)-C(5))-methyltransferase RlmD [Fulvivirgaceae bacterium BMA10]